MGRHGTKAISEEEKIYIESLYDTNGYDTRKLLTQFPYDMHFRQLYYVLILFLIVTVNEFLK